MMPLSCHMVTLLLYYIIVSDIDAGRHEILYMLKMDYLIRVY